MYSMCTSKWYWIKDNYNWRHTPLSLKYTHRPLSFIIWRACVCPSVSPERFFSPLPQPSRYVCVCVCVRVCFSYFSSRNYWIGLFKPSDTATRCRCTSEGSACEACRATWTWIDGTPMTWWGAWASRRPDSTGDQCVRITYTYWADYRCGYKFKYICERGMINCVSHRRLHSHVNSTSMFPKPRSKGRWLWTTCNEWP